MSFAKKRRVLIIYGCLWALCLTGYALAQETSQRDAPKMIRKSAGVLEASATKRVDAVYPPLAKSAQVTGSVVVELIIDEDGNVTAAQAVSGHPLLKDSAVAAARAWKFSPTELSGKRVKVNGTLTFSFGLPDSGQKPGAADDGDIEDAKKAVKANAYSPEAHLKLAEAYADEDLYDDAISAFRRAIELNPAYREAYQGLASIYRQQNKRDDEVDVYRKAIAALPNDSVLLEAAAGVLSDTERYAEAIDVQKRVVQIKTDDSNAVMELGWYLFRARRFQDSIAAYQQAIRIRPKNALAYHNIGAAYLNQSRYEDAIEAYSQALKAEPDYRQADKVHREMGSALLRSRGEAAAIEEFKRSIDLNPRNAQAYSEMGAAYHSLARYEEAAESLKKAIGLQGTATSHNGLGDVYLHLGRNTEAEKEFREAIRAEPQAVQGYIALASLLFMQNKPDDADSLVRQAMQRLPKNVNGYVLLSSLLQHQGHTAEAEGALRKVLQMDPNNALALNNLGYWMVERNEKIEEALAMIQRAVKAEPKNPSYLDSLGWAYFKHEKFEEAERYLTEAALFGASSEILDHLGDAFLKRGKTAQARDVWQKALALPINKGLAARITEKLNAASK